MDERVFFSDSGALVGFVILLWTQLLSSLFLWTELFSC